MYFFLSSQLAISSVSENNEIPLNRNRISFFLHSEKDITHFSQVERFLLGRHQGHYLAVLAPHQATDAREHPTQVLVAHLKILARYIL